MQIDREVLEEVEAALEPFALCVSEGVVSPENTEPSGHVRVVVVAEYFHRAHTTLARLRKAMETGRMGKRTAEWYVCDRCHKRIDKPYRGGEGGTFSVRFNADYAVAGEAVDWNELCRDCNNHIGGLMSNEIRVAKIMRKSEKDHTND